MLRRFDPWREFFSIRDEIDRLFDRFLATPATATAEFTWSPSIDVYETDSELVVKAELPGMSSKDVDITLTDDSLTIKGEKKQSEEVKSDNYYRRESVYGAFQRTIPLPVPVKQNKVKATFKDGVLEIRLPKEKVESRGIKIKVEEK